MKMTPNEAKELGKAAFHAGIGCAAQDKHYAKRYFGQGFSIKETLALLAAYNEGRHGEYLKSVGY